MCEGQRIAICMCVASSGYQICAASTSPVWATAIISWWNHSTLCNMYYIVLYAHCTVSCHTRTSHSPVPSTYVRSTSMAPVRERCHMSFCAWPISLMDCLQPCCNKWQDFAPPGWIVLRCICAHFLYPFFGWLTHRLFHFLAIVNHTSVNSYMLVFL